jgi:hypothetical protein
MNGNVLNNEGEMKKQKFIFVILLRLTNVPYTDKRSFLSTDDMFWSRLRQNANNSNLNVYTSLKKKIFPSKPLSIH